MAALESELEEALKKLSLSEMKLDDVGEKDKKSQQELKKLTEKVNQQTI